jgi:hypothetical protein
MPVIKCRGCIERKLREGETDKRRERGEGEGKRERE